MVPSHNASLHIEIPGGTNFNFNFNFKFQIPNFNFMSHRRHELNKLTLILICGFIAQLVEQRTGNAEVMGSNPVEALIFFRLLLSNCSN